MSEIENLLNKAQTSLNLGNPKEALSFYQKILDQNPKHVTALLKKVTYLVNLENLMMQSFVMMVLFYKKKKIFWHY